MGNQSIDRRSFLKGAAATAATVIGSNLASGTHVAANAAAAQSGNSNSENSRLRQTVGKNHRQARL